MYFCVLIILETYYTEAEFRWNWASVMFLIKRSFGVLRFLNRRHIWPVRVLAGLTGWLIALLTTGKWALAQELFAQFMHGSFKLAGRRAGFYLRAGWPKTEIAFDPFFNFTEGLKLQHITLLENWLENRRPHVPTEQYAGQMLLIDAAHAHHALARKDTKTFDAKTKDFVSNANMLLDNIQVKETLEIPATDVEDTPGFTEYASQVLRDFEKDLPIADWNWFVIGGTFLGLVRDKGFLPHDEDLDVGLFLDGLDVDHLQAIFAQSSHFTVAKFDTQEQIVRDETGQASLRYMPAMLKLVHANGINLDVFLHEHRDGQIWHGSGVHMWVNAPFTLSSYTLEGQDVLGPNPADTYLREHYGDWHIVVKDFSCTTGTTNLAFVKNVYTIAILLKRYAHFAKTDPRDAQKVRRELMDQGFLYAEGDKIKLAPDFV